MKLVTTACLIFCQIISCNQAPEKYTTQFSDYKNRKIKLLPLGKMEDKHIDLVLKELKKYHTTIELMKPEPLPGFAFYEPRKRYRADAIISWLQRRSKGNEAFIAITAADISTSKGDVKDFGIMGLGYKPGRAGVVSLFRLKNKNNLYKVAVHELAHNAGLPHCPEKTCYLRDAKGSDPTDKETAFCRSCTIYLKAKGWNL